MGGCRATTRSLLGSATARHLARDGQRDAAEREGKHRDILAAAQQALQTLAPKLPIRAAIADYLCAAAARLNDNEAVRAGHWEAFVAKPTLERLLDLPDATAEAERAETMRRAAEHIQAYLAHPPQERLTVWQDLDGLENPAWIHKSVLAQAHWLAGDWEAAQRLSAREKVLGWSTPENPQGMVVPFFLMLLAGKSPSALPPNLQHIWQQGLQNSIEFGWQEEADTEDKKLLKRLEQAYVQRLPSLRLSDDQQAELLSWCLKVAKQRVKEIVSNQPRGAYDRAATLMVACVEALRLRGEEKAADKWLNNIRDQYPRHRAFQAELNTAIQRQ